MSAPFTCNGTGEITVTSVSGGNPPYEIDWQGVSTEFVPVGFYEFVITDSDGCEHYQSYSVQNESSIDVELRDQVFLVKVPSRFLQLKGLTPDNVDADNVATYIVTRDPTTTSTGGSRLTFEVETKSLTDAQFLIYGNASDKSVISSVISISGVQSGAVKEFEVQVSKD